MVAGSSPLACKTETGVCCEWDLVILLTTPDLLGRFSTHPKTVSPFPGLFGPVASGPCDESARGETGWKWNSWGAKLLESITWIEEGWDFLPTFYRLGRQVQNPHVWL